MKKIFIGINSTLGTAQAEANGVGRVLWGVDKDVYFRRAFYSEKGAGVKQTGERAVQNGARVQVTNGERLVRDRVGILSAPSYPSHMMKKPWGKSPSPSS